MTEFIMLCGIPGSGKTRFTSSLGDGYNVHSSDAIRLECLGDENNQNNNTDVFKVLHDRVKDNLLNGKNSVYDATNINWKRRRLFLTELAKIPCHKTLYIMATPYNDCVSNQMLRTRDVPEFVINRMYKNFSFPYFYEGWDEIKFVWNFNMSEFDINSAYKRWDDFNQDNPHHALTLGGHMRKAAECFVHLDDDVLYDIALLHDCGKPECKQIKFDEKLGKNKSVYYDHNSTSAYNAMFYLKSMGYNDSEILKMCATIYWHMQPYFLSKDKTIQKYKNMWGEELTHLIFELHDADVMAH